MTPDEEEEGEVDEVKPDQPRLVIKIALVTTLDSFPLSLHRNEERVFLRHTQEKSDCDLHGARCFDSASCHTQHHYLRRGTSKQPLPVPI